MNGATTNKPTKSLEIFERCLRDHAIVGSRYRDTRLLYDLLTGRQDLLGILWGGSHTRKRGDIYSDCDLFCHFKGEPRRVASSLIKELGEHQGVRLVIYQGHWPWMGETLTVFFADDDIFSVDLGIVGNGSALSFFWEPTGVVVRDDTGAITAAIKRNLAAGNLNQYGPTEPFKNLLLLLHKIRKNVARGNLWNAFEYLNQARRYLILMLRQVYIPDVHYLGRPDRDIESVLPSHLIDRLRLTEATVTAKSIVDGALRVSKWCEELSATERFDLSDKYAVEIRALCGSLRRVRPL